MFGGYGISTDGLTIAILADLGQGEKLWLKASPETTGQFESAGCARFTYLAKGVPKSMGYYSAPEDAMESSHEMAPWARLALDAALAARMPKVKAKKRADNSNRQIDGYEPKLTEG
jgi:DNA transformation protein